jgi:Ser/Thr protein kinase RdoA (MazF antagonist)
VRESTEHLSLATARIGVGMQQPQPRVSLRRISYSTFSPSAVRQIAIENYGFNRSLECVLYSRGMNDVYLLCVGDECFAMRISPSRWRSRNTILSEMSAIGHLAARGVEVVRPVLRTDGDVITEIAAPEGLRRAVVFRWVSGRPIKYTSEAHAQRLGLLLARVHTAADDLLPHKGRSRIDLDYLLHRPLNCIRPAVARFPGVLNALDACVGRLAARLSVAQSEFGDWGFCHGDLAAHNARIDGSATVLFDFDLSGCGWRIFDLATFRLEARRQDAEDAAWKPFVAGYLRERPAAADSIRHIGLFMMLRHIWLAGLWLQAAPRMGLGALPDDLFEDLVPYCERLEKCTD